MAESAPLNLNNLARKDQCKSYGTKRCPMDRIHCPRYDDCLNEIILRRMQQRRTLIEILWLMTEVMPNAPENMILVKMGMVASKNNIHFSRKWVDKVIDVAQIREDSNTPDEEIDAIRAAFGVKGREGNAPVKSDLIGLTEEVKIDGDERLKTEA